MPSSLVIGGKRASCANFSRWSSNVLFENLHFTQNTFSHQSISSHGRDSAYSATHRGFESEFVNAKILSEKIDSEWNGR